MENKEMHDENGINGYCVAYLDGYCMLKIGPGKCYNDGDYNTCLIRTSKNIG